MPSEQSSPKLNRRSCLKYVAGGLAASASAPSVVGTAAGASGIEDEYGTVIDIVDAGADNTGNESVTSVIQKHVDNDTLIKFPPGRYYMDEQVRLTDFWNLGLVGNDATLVPANYYNFDGPQYRLFRLGTHYAPGNTLHIENFKVDQRANNTGIRGFEVQVSDGLTVRDVTFVGRHDSGTWGPGLFNIIDPDGQGVVKGFRAPDGAVENKSTPGDLWKGPTGILCNHPHKGTITFRDCVLGAFPDNGLYASGGTGRVNVKGGHYENSGTASIRLGGSGGEIRGTTVAVDADPIDAVGQEPIRLDYGNWFTIDNVSLRLDKPQGEGIYIKNDVGGAIIKNSDIRIESPAQPGIEVNPGVGPTYIQNVDIEVNDSCNAILLQGDGSASGAGLQDVTITGDASGSTMRHAIRCERDGCDFRNVQIDQPGGGKRRALALLGSDYFLYDCRFESSHRPVTVLADDVWMNACYSNSYRNYSSIRLYGEANDIRLKNNTFPNGISNWGASNVVETGTSH